MSDKNIKDQKIDDKPTGKAEEKVDIKDTSLNVNSDEERPGIGYEILNIGTHH